MGEHVLSAHRDGRSPWPTWLARSSTSGAVPACARAGSERQHRECTWLRGAPGDGGRDTGSVKVRDYVAVLDVGRALNPAAIEGQIHGGVAQGVGWALYEQVPYDETGQPLAATFIDYPLPTAQRVPKVEPVLVEVQAADGPFGAKGVGDPPVVAGAAAIANAVADATGVRISELPIKSERLFQALSAASAH